MSSSQSDPLHIYIEAITPSLNLLIIGAVWSAALVPLLILLFFWSTPSLRRSPIFLMNVFAVIMGLVVGVLNMQIYVGRILDPNKAFPVDTLLAYVGLLILLPVLMDCILAFRLYAVYPPRATPKRIFTAIFIPIVIFKVARVTNLLVFIVQFSKESAHKTDAEAILIFQRLWDHGFTTKVEWILQVFDNCYTSGWFLWRLWASYALERSTGGVFTQGTARSRTTHKIQTLFYWALSSFFFPCVFSIIQVAIAFNIHNFYLGAYIFITNIYFEIICLLLATIWTVSALKERNDAAPTTFKTISFRVAGVSEATYSGMTSDEHELSSVERQAERDCNEGKFVESHIQHQ
ncbi:hypothetical protein PM082_012732 [Marasmius tenuissimus]|nr:hypothetical protein PM082_012732 [Marasmius tenuissimus]